MFKEIIEDKNVLHSFLTKYRGSLGANGDFRQQIFARDCNNSRETEEVKLCEPVFFLNSRRPITTAVSKADDMMPCF